MKALIRKLTEAYGPSGREAELRQIVRAEIKGQCDYISEDALGNLLGVIKAKAKTGKRIMLAAHMDEIGLIVSHIDERGFARVAPIGGVFPLNCVGSRVRFASGKPGVIGLEEREDPKRAPTLDQLYLDLGAADRASCPVQVGEMAVFDRPFVEAGTRLISKAMDDRIGVAVLIEAMRRLKRTPHEVQFAFTVQEEVGLRGARTAAFHLDPDLALSVDITLTGDTPRCPPMAVSLGRGPAVKVRDGLMISDPRVVEWMTATASAQRIPHQLEVLERGSTDASVIQVSRAGVPAGCLSIPCRYAHSPSEMVDLGDVEHAVKLLLAMLQGPVGF
ncbi:MAG: M42 family metallopeptidase [Anaerolineales bacterium]|nr:M42 family metallopeptidase [Anaerolineales bacterium]